MTNWTGIRWMMGGTGLALAAIATMSLTANTVSADPNDNELVIEAARLSITHDAREAVIEYEPTPRVHLREYT